jgi:GTP-binding protein
LEKNVQKQTRIAQAEADLILLMVDGRTPIAATDRQLAAGLVRTGKPVILIVNKIDTRNAKTEAAAAEYVRLGLGQPFLTSSVNGAGLGDALDAIAAELDRLFPADDQTQTAAGLKIAFVGKPNVGKSSLINALIKQERLLVHDQAGTTRSTVEIPFESGGQQFILLDTAGIKKKWNQDADVAAAAAFQSIRTIDAADVIFFTIDASQPLTAQDQIVARQILDAQKACVIVLNKIELLAEKERDELLDKLPDWLPQMWYLPVLFTSAHAGEGVDRLLSMAVSAHEAAVREIAPEELDAFLDKIIQENMPGKMDDQRTPKIYNLKQIGSAPPAFTLTVNFPAAIATAWKKWLEKQFRIKFGFEGTPIVIKYLRRS